MSTIDSNLLRYPTDFNLLALDLHTSLVDGVINLKPFMIELNLFEDIYSPTLSGEIVLQDALGLISKYHLSGSEFIQIQLQKTAQDPTFHSRNYRVYKISKRVTSDSNNYEVYVLNFCSEEFLISEQYRVSKSVKGKKISDIITDVLDKYILAGKSNKKKFIDATTGVYDFILPNKKLFETINWLATYARPGNNKPGADMLFFENTKGYHFHSLQTLYSQEVYQTYKYDPKNLLINNGKIDIQQQLTNASDFEMLDFFDTLAATSNGTFANKVLTIDPLTRKVHKGTFDYNFYQGSLLNKKGLINNYKNRLGGTMYGAPPTQVAGLEYGALRLAPSNSEQKKHPYIATKPDAVSNDIYIETYLPNRVSQIGLVNYMRIKISIPGDPNIMAGAIVKFNTYGISPSTYSDNGTGREPDPFYSGKYLVNAVRHIVKNNGYITVLELTKESVTGEYAGTNASLKPYINGVQI